MYHTHARINRRASWRQSWRKPRRRSVCVYVCVCVCVCACLSPRVYLLAPCVACLPCLRHTHTLKHAQYNTAYLQAQLEKKEASLKTAEASLAKLESRMARGIGDYDPASTQVRERCVCVKVCVCECVCVCMSKWVCVARGIGDYDPHTHSLLNIRCCTSRKTPPSSSSAGR